MGRKMMKSILYFERRGEWKKTHKDRPVAVSDWQMGEKVAWTLNRADSVWAFKARLLSEGFLHQKVSVILWCLVPRLVMILSFGLLLHSAQILQLSSYLLAKGKDESGDCVPW